MWNPSAFIEKGKQADDQRQPVQTHRQGRGEEGGAHKTRQTVLAAGRHERGRCRGREPGFWDVRQKLCGHGYKTEAVGTIVGNVLAGVCVWF